MSDLKISLHNSFQGRLDEIEQIILALSSQVSQAVHYALPKWVLFEKDQVLSHELDFSYLLLVDQIPHDEEGHLRASLRVMGLFKKLINLEWKRSL